MNKKKTTMVTYTDAQKAAASIRKAVDPFSILLFGSVAREGTGNDLDLLVLVDDPGKSIEAVGARIHKSLEPYYRKISIAPFIISLSDWQEFQKKGSPFYTSYNERRKVLFMKNARRRMIETGSGRT